MNYTVIIIIAIVTFLCGGLISYIILKPKLKQVEQTNLNIQELNKKQILENSKLLEKNNKLAQANTNLMNLNADLEKYNVQLNADKNSISKHINDLNNNLVLIEKQAEEAADSIYKAKLEAAESKLQQELVTNKEQLIQQIKTYEEWVNTKREELQCDYEAYEASVARLKSIHDAAVDAAKRAEAMSEKQDFYRIQLSDEDIHEIEILRQVEPYLRNKEPLNKVIWKCYYEKPVTDLIGRVIGSGTHTGIYKITEISTGKCYIGQSASLSDRWKQHIKRGVGAEAPTRNKLYPAMLAARPENFTFEVVEECDRAALDEREDFWQNYFKAKEFGFSIK